MLVVIIGFREHVTVWGSFFAIRGNLFRGVLFQINIKISLIVAFYSNKIFQSFKITFRGAWSAVYDLLKSPLSGTEQAIYSPPPIIAKNTQNIHQRLSGVI